MPLTHPFSETVRARAQRDPEFRAALIQEALVALVEGDVPGVRVLLRDVINATLGFQALAAMLGRKDKSLMRSFSVKGNPTLDTLAAVLSALVEREGCAVDISVARGPWFHIRADRSNAIALDPNGTTRLPPQESKRLEAAAASTQVDLLRLLGLDIQTGEDPNSTAPAPSHHA